MPIIARAPRTQPWAARTPRVCHRPEAPGHTSRVVIFRGMNQQASAARGLPAAVLGIFPLVDNCPGPGLPDSEHLHRGTSWPHLRAAASGTARVPQEGPPLPARSGRPLGRRGHRAGNARRARPSGHILYRTRSRTYDRKRRRRRGSPLIAVAANGPCPARDRRLRAPCSTVTSPRLVSPLTARHAGPAAPCRILRGRTGGKPHSPSGWPTGTCAEGSRPARSRAEGRWAAITRRSLPRFLADPYEAGQLSPVRDRLRRYRITVRTSGGCNREDRQMARAGIVGDLYAAGGVGQRLVTLSSTDAAQSARPRRPRPGRRDSAGARPGEDRAGCSPLPGSSDRRISGIPRRSAGAIRRPARDRYPDRARLTTARGHGPVRGLPRRAGPDQAAHRPVGQDRARVDAPAGVALGHRGGRTPSCPLAGRPGSQPGKALHTAWPGPHTASALFTADAPATVAGRR